MSAQVKLLMRNPGIPARRAASKGNGGASLRTAACSLRFRFSTSSSRRCQSGLKTFAASASVAGPSVEVLSPGGLTAPASETKASSSAGLAQSLAPVIEKTLVGLDRDRHVEGYSIQNRGRPIKVAESMARHVDRQAARREGCLTLIA